MKLAEAERKKENSWLKIAEKAAKLAKPKAAEPGQIALTRNLPAAKLLKKAKEEKRNSEEKLAWPKPASGVHNPKQPANLAAAGSGGEEETGQLSLAGTAKR